MGNSKHRFFCILAFACAGVLGVAAEPDSSGRASGTQKSSQERTIVGKRYIADLGGGVTMEFMPIPAGTFMKGSPEEEEGRGLHEDRIRLKISAFSLGKTEVTQAQWKALMKKNPSEYKGDNRPVESVSWIEAMSFCKKLTARERSAGRLPRNVKFTLPTEAQWEYACRAGTTTRFYTGNTEADLDRAGWFWKMGPYPVGKKQANGWGLYDMHGNVWEWCLNSDKNSVLAWGKNEEKTQPPEEERNPIVEELVAAFNSEHVGSGKGVPIWSCTYFKRKVRKKPSLKNRLIRGGGWSAPAQWCRSACRVSVPGSDAFSGLGFRVALVQDKN